MHSRIMVKENGVAVPLHAYNPEIPPVKHPIQAWYGLNIEITTPPKAAIAQAKGESFHRSNPNPMLVVPERSEAGGATFWSGIKKYQIDYRNSHLMLWQANFELDRGVWEGHPSSVTTIEFRPSEVSKFLPEESRHLELINCFSFDDTVIRQLVGLMRAEYQAGCMNGRSYAEGLSIALINYIAKHHSNNDIIASSCRRLGIQQIRKIDAYIKENITTDLSIAEIGQLVHLSSFHFARLFKATIGVTPHRYIMERRIEEAQHLLNSGLKLSEIAAKVGFSSQSHLTHVFRRLTGVAPTKTRQR